MATTVLSNVALGVSANHTTVASNTSIDVTAGEAILIYDGTERARIRPGEYTAAGKSYPTPLEFGPITVGGTITLKATKANTTAKADL